METLLEILYASGLRVSELVTLPLVAVERDPTMLVVRGKGDKERLVPLSDPARVAIADVAACPRRLLDEGETSRFLFPSRGRTGHLTRQRFAQLLKEAALAAGIDPARVSPHVLAPRLRQPSARGRRRFAQRAAHAGPCRHRHDPDLHPRPDEKLRSLVQDKHPLARRRPRKAARLTGFRCRATPENQ